MIAGIDYSINSPSVCIYKHGQFNPSSCNFSFFALDKWRSRWSEFSNVNCYKMPKDLTQVAKFSFLADWVIEQIRWYDGRVEQVYIEDYSYGSVGRVFNIAENVGILKYKLKEENFPCISVPPTVIKKYATGKGNSKKEDMLVSWNNEPESFQLVQELGNPGSDIVDSYFICKYGFSLHQ